MCSVSVFLHSACSKKYPVPSPFLISIQYWSEKVYFENFRFRFDWSKSGVIQRDITYQKLLKGYFWEQAVLTCTVRPPCNTVSVWCRFESKDVVCSTLKEPFWWCRSKKNKFSSKKVFENLNFAQLVPWAFLKCHHLVPTPLYQLGSFWNEKRKSDKLSNYHTDFFNEKKTFSTGEPD